MSLTLPIPFLPAHLSQSCTMVYPPPLINGHLSGLQHGADSSSAAIIILIQHVHLLQNA